MARDVITGTLTAACPDFANLKASLPPATSNSGAERTALTHALSCGTCRPIADRIRAEQADRTARLAAEAAEEAA